MAGPPLILAMLAFLLVVSVPAPAVVFFVLARLRIGRPWRILATCAAASIGPVLAVLVRQSPEAALSSMLSFGPVVAILAWLPFLTILEARWQRGSR